MNLEENNNGERTVEFNVEPSSINPTNDHLEMQKLSNLAPAVSSSPPPQTSIKVVVSDCEGGVSNTQNFANNPHKQPESSLANNISSENSNNNNANANGKDTSVSFRTRHSIISDKKNRKTSKITVEKAHPVILEDLDDQEAMLPDQDSTEGLALYKEDYSIMNSISGYLRANTFQTTAREDAKKRPKPKLGGILGVYLPTLQHIFGVIMFLRLYWIVGCMGFISAFCMVFLCCLCTFLTSISMSAIATNGKVESGGSYFMISRNLGPQFGSAVGILFYLANAVATSMYLVGTVEILLTYVAPSLPQFHTALKPDADGIVPSHNESDMYNNFRIYTTILLFIVFCIVALGVKFVQIFAPVTLACVIISIICLFIGGFVRNPSNSVEVCYLGDRLLVKKFYTIDNVVSCNKTILEDVYCNPSNLSLFCDYFFKNNEIRLESAMPGFATNQLGLNLWPKYMVKGESSPGVKGMPSRDVIQDGLTTFFLLLAIYFPSVTGIMTGSNMSGDLKDPQKDIPRYTIAAQVTTSVVYLLLVIIFAGVVRREVLFDKFGVSMGGGMVVAELCWPHRWVLLVGSLTSTFGAGLQCLCSAPRLLQSIAKDDVIPFLRIFTPVTRCNEPLRALLISYVFAECAVLLGNVDLIAPIVDFFFLMCYAFVNLACALQNILNTPNWRPRFKYYHWTLSLLGAGLCLFIMFATYWYYALVTIALCAAIYKYVEYAGAEKEWGDGIRGLKLAGAKYSLLNLEDARGDSCHTKNWRPQILILAKINGSDSEDSEKVKYPELVSFAKQMKGSRGLLLIVSFIEGDYGDREVRDKADRVKKNLRHTMKQLKVRGFVQVIVCDVIKEGISTMIQSIGLGALKPNTVMVGWPYTWRTYHADNEQYNDFLDAIHRVATAEMCLLIPKGIQAYPNSTECHNTIDVWWIMNDGGLLMILPVLLKRHKLWSSCQLRVFTVATQFDNSIKMKESLVKWLYDLRISATVNVVELPTTDVISAYMQEKTLALEERLKLLNEIKLTSKEAEQEPQAVLDNLRKRSRGQAEQKLQLPGGANNQYTFSPAALAQMREAMEMKSSQLSSHDPETEELKKMHNAMELNMLIREKSEMADLIILNLPGPPKNREGLTNYINYLDVLSDGLNRVLLVRGTGREVITIYS